MRSWPVPRATAGQTEIPVEDSDGPRAMHCLVLECEGSCFASPAVAGPVSDIFSWRFRPLRWQPSQLVVIVWGDITYLVTELINTYRRLDVDMSI